MTVNNANLARHVQEEVLKLTGNLSDAVHVATGALNQKTVAAENTSENPANSPKVLGQK